jgi:hypothetical protein
LFSEHLEGNGRSLYIVLIAKRRSGLMKRMIVKGAAKKSVKIALTNQVLFSRKNYVRHANQNRDCL